MTRRAASKIYQLEHLYHGYFTEAGHPVGTPQLVAYSPGVAVGQWKECRRLTAIAPIGDAEASGPESLAIGFFRGESVDHILVHVQRNWAADGISNPPTVHYILLPTVAAEALTNNLQALRERLDEPMPAFAVLDNQQRPFNVAAPSPRKPKERIAALTALLETCGNDARTVRGLLAAITLAQPIAVINSPPSIDARLAFIEGLLSLLPPPARPGVTFVTNTDRSEGCPALVKFLAGGSPAADDQVFDWGAARLLTEPPKSAYSAFAVGQMQLNPVALLKQFDGLSAITRHRLQREPFPDALAAVARRAVMDIALAEGQALDRDAVIDLLQNDPTLEDAQRVDYAVYLLRLALSLDEPKTADALVPLIETNSALAIAVLKEFDLAAQGAQAVATYRLLNRWLSQGLDMGEAWPRVLSRIALAYARELVQSQSHQAVAALLEELIQAPVALDPTLARQMLRSALPLARNDERLARAILRLAAQHLEAADFDALLADAALIAQFPRPVQEALAYLGPTPPPVRAPKGLLEGAALSLGPHGDVVLARFAERAVVAGRHELVDVPALEVLRELARSRRALQFVQVLQHTIWALARSKALSALPDPGPFLMAQILLLLDLPDDFAQLLLLFQFVVFGGQRRDEFRAMVVDLLAQTPLEAGQAMRTLHAMASTAEPVDHAARVLAYRTVLQAHNWDPDIRPAVGRLLDELGERPELVLVLGYPFMADLLRHVATHKHKANTLRVAGLLFASLSEDVAEVAPVLRKVWPVFVQEDDLHEAALEWLRGYARRLPVEQAARLTRVFSGDRTAREREAVATSLALRPLFDARDFAALTEDVRLTADLLSDLLITFELNKPPGPITLSREIDSRSGSLSHDEVRTLARQALALAHYLEEIGHPRRRGDTAALIANAVAPRSALDLLRWLGGYFAGGALDEREIDPNTTLAPFGNRSTPMIYREIDAAANLLGNLLQAFPPDQPPKLSVEALKAEIHSRWRELRLQEQREFQDVLARDCQTLAMLIARIADTGGSKSFLGADVADQVEAGKLPPRSVIDALRWVSGYYAGKHRSGG